MGRTAGRGEIACDRHLRAGGVHRRMEYLRRARCARDGPGKLSVKIRLERPGLGIEASERLAVHPVDRSERTADDQMATDVIDRSHLNGQARTVDYVGGHLIVGGAFTSVNGVNRKALASLDPEPGALQPYLDAQLSGTVSSTAGPTQVLHSAVNSTGTQMAVAGNFTSAGGATHWRVILLNLGASSATVSAWNAPILQQPCNSSGIPNY